MSDIGNRKHGSRRKGGFKGVKRALLKVGPGPWLIFSGEQVEGSDNVGEVGDKFTIEVCKSEERSDTFD